MAVERLAPMRARLARLSTLEDAAVLVACVAWIFSRVLLLFPLRADSNDVRLYFSVADAWLKGSAPYASGVFEYPPGAAVLALVPRAFISDVESYPLAFALWMLCFDALCAALVFVLCRGEALSRARASIAVVAYALASACLGELALQRYDVAVAATMLGAIVLARRRRHALAAAVLAVGVWLKLVPVVLLPLILADGVLARADATGATLRALLRDGAREGARVVAAFGAALLALFAPFFTHLDGLRASFAYQGERGVQIESVWATALMVLDRVAVSLDLSETFDHGASHLSGRGVAAVATASAALMPIVIAGALALAIRQQKRWGARWLVDAAAIVLLALLCVSRVLSPQFLLWILPLLAVVAGRPNRPAGVASMTALAVLTSGFVLLAGYGALQELDVLAIGLMLLRNGLLVALLVVLIRASPVASAPPRARSVALTLGLLAVLAVDMNFREVTGGDFWLHRAVGNDILATHAIPVVDTYSATARGAEFVAHEWLSSIVIASVDGAFGPIGLFVLRAGAVFAVAARLVLAGARRDRRSFVVVPLAVLAIVVIESRAEMRPHLLALVVIAVFSTSLARWRRRGSLQALWPLVPLHAVWANLHASCFLGPALLAILGAVALALPIRRRRLGGSRVPRDAAHLLGVAACAFAACMLNPRGPRLFTFAFELSFESVFVHEYVDEWRGAFEAYLPSAQMISYFLWIGACWLLVLVGGRSRARALQVAMALAVTWLSLRAVRFQAETAVLFFPIALERAAWIVRRLRAPDVRTALAFDVALVLLFAWFGAFAFRDQLGVGYDRNRPQVAVELLRAHKASVVFCEYEDGGYLIDQLRPDVKVVMDGRIDVYGPERLRDYRRANADMAFFDSYVELHHVDAVLLGVGVGVPNVALYRHLMADPSTWRLADDGERHVLFLRSVRGGTGSPTGGEAR